MHKQHEIMSSSERSLKVKNLKIIFDQSELSKIQMRSSKQDSNHQTLFNGNLQSNDCKVIKKFSKATRPQRNIKNEHDVGLLN